MKKIFSRIFIDGLSGMASGLFATLIVGTIIAQVGKLVPGEIGEYLTVIGSIAKTITGAGIGVGVAAKLGASALVTVSSAVVGMIGAFPVVEKFALGAPGEPLGAFIAAYVAVELGGLVSGKTKVDIILTPLVCVLTGSAAGFLVGPPISKLMSWIGVIVNQNVEANPIIGGLIVSVVMGICLTLPISSAAIGVSLGLSGLAAGAAVVGCCCNMVGFAVASFRENKWGGLVAQGLGTSMLQMPNIVRRPLIWIPAIVSSAVLGPVAAAVFKISSSAIGSGMGTSGLIGPIETYFTMVEAGTDPVIVLVLVVLMLIVLPGALTLAISEGMRKAGWIKKGDMKLTV
ncbi:MAG: PTS sugar transporter subunit IIC [Ruminococcaceae bacterium]|nr:PTS sugar transporter subunit IIC [Oscillospiraceae bacterium]